MNLDEAYLLTEEKEKTKNDFLKELTIQSTSILKYLYKLGYMYNLQNCDKNVKAYWINELKSPLSQVCFFYKNQASEIEINSALIKNIDSSFKIIQRDLFSTYSKKNNGNSKLFNNINEIKYEDFIDIVNKYVPSISKFLSENIYNFKNGMAKEVMNVFLTKLFN